MPAGERCNCFPASTLVRGQFVAGTRAWYEGPLTEIVTGAGRRLTVTPGHPIATPYGWVAAGQLKIGDNILAYSPDVERPGVAGSHDVEAKPALIEQVFDSFSLAGLYEIRDGQAVDFDGDGQRIVGQIEIVRPGVTLLDNGEPGGAEQVAERDFRGGDVGLFGESGDGGPAGSVGVVAASVADGVPGATQPAADGVLSLVVGNVGPTQPLAVGIGADFHATFAETAGQDRAAIAGILRDLLERNAGGVTVEQVVQVWNYEAAAGHVYDLQSVHGLVIALDSASPNRSGGIVTANCQCTIISSLVMEGLEETIDTPATAATPDAWDQAAVDKMDVKTVVAGHPGLRDKMAKVDKIREKLGAEIRLLEEELETAQRGVDYYVNLMAEINGPAYESGSAEEYEQLKKYDEARVIKNAMQAVRNQKMDALRTAQRDAREKTLRVLAVKTKNRLDAKAHYLDKHELGYVTNYKDDKGNLRSTGKYTRNMKHDVKQATDFMSRVVAKPRPGDKSKFYPDRDLDPDTDWAKMQTIRIHAAEPKARAWHYGYDTSMNVVEVQSSGISMPTDAGASVAVHEMGHHLESTVPGIAKRSKEFQAYRIAKAGTPNRKMKDALPGYDYRDSEVGNEDDFARAFDRQWKPGKTYHPDRLETPEKSSAYYTGKNYSDGQTELTSMGVQLLFDDPVGFAERDPEFFKYMMGVLDGTIR